MSNSISSLVRANVGQYTSGASTGVRPNQVSNDATVQANAGQDSGVINAISINAVPVDIASYGAILGSIESAGGSFATGAGQQAALQDVMAMIGKTLSQGQGGYYIAINAPGAALMTSMTPGQLQAYMQSGGTLYQESVVSSDQHTYSLYDLLRQAIEANARTERLQAAGGAVDPRLRMAEALLDQMRADSAPKGSMRSLLFGSSSNGRNTAKSIRTLVLRMDGDDNKNGVRLTIVYYAPGAGNCTAGPSEQPSTGSAPTILQLTA